MSQKQTMVGNAALGTDMVQLTMMPMQWGSLKGIDDIEPLNPGDYVCLAEIREVLKKHGKSERFGVALLHKHFDMKDNEVLLEETDRERRIQTVRPTLKSQAGRTIETQWLLGEQGIISVQHCPYDGNLEEKHRYRIDTA